MLCFIITDSELVEILIDSKSLFVIVTLLGERYSNSKSQGKKVLKTKMVLKELNFGFIPLVQSIG